MHEHPISTISIYYIHDIYHVYIYIYNTYPPCPMPWNFARRLLAPSVAGWCPRHYASQRERCNILRYLRMDGTDSPKVYGFSKSSQACNSGMPWSAYVHLGSTVRSSPSPSRWRLWLEVRNVEESALSLAAKLLSVSDSSPQIPTSHWLVIPLYNRVVMLVLIDGGFNPIPGVNPTQNDL